MRWDVQWIYFCVCRVHEMDKLCAGRKMQMHLNTRHVLQIYCKNRTKDDMHNVPLSNRQPKTRGVGSLESGSRWGIATFFFILFNQRYFPANTDDLRFAILVSWLYLSKGVDLVKRGHE